MKVTNLILLLVLCTTTVFGQVSPFSYRQCINATLRNNYRPAPCEITGNSTPSSIWMIQVGAYRNGITPLPGILMIPYELNRYYLFAFSDVGQYNGSLFFSSREAAAKFIEDNGLSEIFCQVFPALFPFSDVIAYTDPVRIYAHDQRSVPVDTVVPYNYNNDTSTIDNFSNMYTSSITYHKVQKGETLYSISKKYNVTVQSLQNLNNIGDTNIAVDRVIRIN